MLFSYLTLKGMHWLTKLLLCSYIFLSACFACKACALSVSIRFKWSLTLVSDIWRSPARCPVSSEHFHYSALVWKEPQSLLTFPNSTLLGETTVNCKTNGRFHWILVWIFGLRVCFVLPSLVRMFVFVFFSISRLCLKFIMAANQPSQCGWESLCANGTCCYVHQTTTLPGNKQDRCCPHRQGAGGKRWQWGRTVTHLVETHGTHRGTEQVQE